MSYIVIEKTDEKNFGYVDRMIALGMYREYPTLEQARKRGRAFLSTNKKNGFVIVIGKYSNEIFVGDYVGTMSWTDGSEYYPTDKRIAELHTGYAYVGVRGKLSGFVGADGKIKATFNQVNKKTKELLERRY